MKRLVWALLLLLALVPTAARAASVQVFLGATTFTVAHKDAAQNLRAAAVIAFPLFAVRARSKRWTFFAEDVPPLRAHFNVRYGVHDLKAGYGDAVLHYWLPGRRIGFGLGESLYVRQSYLGGPYYEGVRAAGIRYEVLGAVPLAHGSRIVARLALAPGMHQRYMDWFVGARFTPPPYYRFGTASLVDASVRLERPHGSRHTWLYGLRYVNYAGGNFGRYFDSAEERSGLLAAFAAWGFRIGR